MSSSKTQQAEAAKTAAEPDNKKRVDYKLPCDHEHRGVLCKKGTVIQATEHQQKMIESAMRERAEKDGAE